MFIRKKTTIFKGEKSYLVDNSGENIVDLGFDELEFLNGGNLVKYVLAGKTNIVTVDFINQNKKKSAYTSACVWDEKTDFNGFYLLSNKQKDGLKFVDNSGTIKLFKNGYVYSVGQDRSVIFVEDRFDAAASCKMAYTEAGHLSLNFADVPDLKVKGGINPSLFSIVGSFADGDNLVDNDDLQALIDLFKKILLEDIRNFNKPTKKYILSNFGSLTFAKTLNDKLLDSYIVRFDEKTFDTVEEAKQNAINVLALLKKKVTKRFENEKLAAQRIAAEQELADSLKIKEVKAVASACDELNKF